MSGPHQEYQISVAKIRCGTLALVRDKVRDAWNAFQIYANAKQGIRRVNHHLRAMQQGVFTGVGTIDAAKDLAKNGPSQDDLESVAWKVANVGFRQASAAYHEAKNKKG
jgi:hypothetical protein